MKKKIFLIHTTIDKPFVRQLAFDLQSFGISTWLDEAEISFGESIIKKIQIGLESASYVIIVISKASMKSTWVEAEMETAIVFELEGRINQIIPLVIDDAEIPPFLKRKSFMRCIGTRDYKLNLGKLVEGIYQLKKPMKITAGQAFEKLKSECKAEGSIVSISQQGLTQIIGSQHLLLRNLVYRDAFMGASRYWVFEFFEPRFNSIRTFSIVDGKIGELPEKIVEGWATQEQKERVKFQMTEINPDGSKKLTYGIRTTDFKPQETSKHFPDSNTLASG